MNDLYGINLNYQSITLYLNDNELLSTYHPKHISTHIVYNDSRQSTEGGILTHPNEDTPRHALYKTMSTLTSAPEDNINNHVNDSIHYMDDNMNQLPAPPSHHLSKKSFQHCTCSCQCINFCFCGTLLCPTVSENNIPLDQPPDWFEQNLDAAVCQRYADIILYFHQQRGHPNFRHIIDDFKNGVFDDDDYLSRDRPYLYRLRAMATLVPPDSFVCLNCPGYKIRKSKLIRRSNRVLSHPMAKGYIDAIGPFPIGYGDARYILIYRDEQSNYGLGAVLTENISSKYKPPISAWRLQARDDGWSMDKLHFDAGSISLDTNFREFLTSLDISQEYAAPGQQWANSMVERFIGTISKNAKVILKASALPLHFWPFAYLHAIFLHNLVTRKRFQNPDYSKKYKYLVPYEIVKRKKFAKKLPVFGQLVYARLADPARANILDPAGRRCVFLGIDQAMHDAYILLNLDTMRVIRSNDILSIKNLFGYSLKPILPNRPIYIAGDTEPSSQLRTPSDADIINLPETRAGSPSIPPQLPPVNPVDSLPLAHPLEDSIESRHPSVQDVPPLLDDPYPLQDLDPGDTTQHPPEDYVDTIPHDTLPMDTVPISRDPLLPLETPMDTSLPHTEGMRRSSRLSERTLHHWRPSDSHPGQRIRRTSSDSSVPMHLRYPSEIFTAPRDPISLAIYCTQVILDYEGAYMVDVHGTHMLLYPEQPTSQIMSKAELVMVFNSATTSRYCPQYQYLSLDTEETQSTLDNYLSVCLDRPLNVQAHMLAAHKRVFAEGKWHDLPRNFAESESPLFQSKFGPANKKEIDMILEYGVFSNEPVDLPPGKKALDTKYVWDIKTNQDGAIERYKARLCIRGFLQEYLEHFHKTYAPTAFKETIRLIFYLIYSHGFHQYYFDIKGAFLNGSIDEEIYVKIPPGFPHYNPHVTKYYRLLKALYGTKQAAAQFYDHLHRVLLAIGYHPADSDPCLWFKRNDKGLSVMATHVDDLPGCSQDPQECETLATALVDWYELSNKLVINKLLGMHIHITDSNSCIVYNDLYIYGLLEELDLTHIKPRSTPGTPRQVFLPNTLGQADPVMHAKFRTIIGSCIFMQCNWRPDIDYTVGRLSEHMHNPSFEHFDAAIDLLRYLKHTATRGIKFSIPSVPSEGPTQVDVLAFFDADWAKEADSKSISGWVISYVTPEEADSFRVTGVIPPNNLVRWASKKQSDHVADSTESAETVAAVAAAKDVIWLRGLLKELGLMPSSYRSSVLSGDNRSTLLSIEDEKVTATNRWSARKTAFVRQAHHNGDITPWWTPTKENPADGFTKYLDPTSHYKCFDTYMGEATVPHALHRPKK